jgi:small neutral amino acid transporter SnatA (MarC family)
MITTVVILAKEYGYLLTIAGIALNLLLSRLLFKYAHFLLKLIGKEGALIFAKVMGLILVAIGIEFIRSSLA